MSDLPIELISTHNILAELLFLKNAHKKNSKKEDIDTRKEDIDTRKEDIDTRKEDIDTRKEDIDTRKEDINKQKIDIQTQFLETKIAYNFLDDQYKASPQQLDQFKETQLTSDIIEQLQTANINIDDYMAFWYTAEQLIKESGELTEEQIIFVNQFNTLNKSLNIDYQITIPTEKMQFANKPKNLSDIITSPTAILAYPSVREYTSKQPNIINKPTEKIDINPKFQEDVWENI